MASSRFTEEQTCDVSAIKDDSAFNCNDLSFIIEDILSKRIGSNAILHADNKPNKQVRIVLLASVLATGDFSCRSKHYMVH